MKKKICWITGSCFTETDYNLGVMQQLSSDFEIHWFVIGTKKNFIEKEKYAIFKKIPDFHLSFMTNKYRMRDPRSLLFYIRLIRQAKELHADVTYFNVAPEPSFAIATLFTDKKKTVFAAHDGKAQNDSSSFGLMRTFSYNTIFRHSWYVNMFSKSQANIMRKTYPQNRIHTMVLPLKDFGKSDKKRPDNFVRFLSFGFIIYQKNIDLLIDAAEILYNRGYRNFKVSINGGCKEWNYYEDKIKHPDIFECNPYFVSNEKLLDLFATSHYAVFPYRRVSQSGVLKLAFNYNLPVITSNIGAFKEEVVEDINGFFFEVGNVSSLADVMETALNRSDKEYSSLKHRMKEYTDKTYSLDKIVSYYKDLFTDFIK